MHRERWNRLSVAYAMIGLLFACLSAALIVVSIHPVPKTVVETSVVDYSVVGTNSPTVRVETRMLRSHRRLTDTGAFEVSLLCASGSTCFMSQ